MINLDKLEQLAKTATSGLAGDRVMFAVHVMDPEGILALTAEVRRLRADAERYQWAISREDRAEELYGAVMSNSPDFAAINAEIDAVRAEEST